MSADTIVPSPGNVLDWDRYQYVRSNPLKFVDPTGHDPRCGPDGVFCDNLVNPLDFSLPSSSDLRDEGIENSGTVEKNLRWYNEIRFRLLIDFGTLYVDGNGKIKDEVLVAMILTMEFGEGAKDFSITYYTAGLSAVSQQYHGKRWQYSESSAVCKGNCSKKEQLLWLQGMHAVRTSLGSASNLFSEGDNETVYWQSFLDDAERAIAAPLVGLDGKRYWAWGDYPSERGDFRLSTSNWPLNTSGYFEIYGYHGGWYE